MKLKMLKKRFAAGLSMALVFSLGSVSTVSAGTSYELFELVEGEASDSGYIPAYDPAEEPDAGGMPAGDESSIAPSDTVTDGRERSAASPAEADFTDSDVSPVDSARIPEQNADSHNADSDGTVSQDTVSQDTDAQDTDVFVDESSVNKAEPFVDAPSDDFDLFSDEQEAESAAGLYTASGLPSRFSLIEAGYSTPVKDQGVLGMCWAFSALESIETGMIKRGLADNSLSLSETHLTYSAFHGMNNQENDPTSDETFFARDNSWTQLGGNKFYSTATLARGYGVAYDSDYPLALSFRANSADSPGSFSSILDDVISDEDKQTSEARLKNCYWLPEINPNGIVVSSQERAVRVNRVKTFIMNYGAVEIGLYTNSRFYPYDSGTNSFCCETRKSPNHSVALIGWDDSKVTAAAEPGAFLMQNSWGTDEGEGGLFWLSYEDRSMKSPSFYEMENRPIGTSGDLIISQYDGTGYGSVIKPANPSNDLRISGANVFVSEVPQYLKQVSFYAGAAPLSYTVSVYRYVKTSPDTGKLVYTQSGSNLYSGYYTVDLKEAVPIGKGEKFAIQLQFDSKEGYVPHERSSNKIYTADYGESYLFDGEQWDDLMDISYPDSNTGEQSSYACNLCIKGIGVQAGNGISMAPSKPEFDSVTVSGGNKINVSVKKLEDNVDGYDFTIGTSPSFLSTKKYARVNKNVSNGKTSFPYLAKGTYYLAVHGYRLNAAGKKVLGPWSGVNMVKITAATPGTPKLKSVSAGKGSLNASYTKASSAYRYEYVLSKKSFSGGTLNPGSRYKTYTNRKYGQVKLAGLAKGTYYFGVRAYTLFNGKTKVYGKWIVKKVTVR